MIEKMMRITFDTERRIQIYAPRARPDGATSPRAGGSVALD
jgi:hypothetical protein